MICYGEIRNDMKPSDSAARRNRRGTVPLLLLSLLCLTSCTHRLAQAPTLPVGSITIPARLIGHSFIVDVKIGGHGPFRMLLDTGASSLVISPEIAEQLRKAGDLENIWNLRAGTSDGGSQRFETVVVSHVELGAYQIPTATTMVVDLGPVQSSVGLPIDGIVGMELFRFLRSSPAPVS